VAASRRDPIVPILHPSGHLAATPPSDAPAGPRRKKSVGRRDRGICTESHYAPVRAA